MVGQSPPARGAVQSEASASRQLALAVLAAVCGALITGALNWSPQVTLIGAALGSAIPALATFAGPYQPLRAGLAIVVTATALFLTYGGFTLFDFATERAATFPLPPAAPQPVPRPDLPEPVLPEPVLPEPVLPEPVLPEPVLPEPVLPEPVLPEPVLPEPVLPEPVLPEPVPPDPPKPTID